MLLLVTTAHPQIVAHAHPNLGRLVQPRHYWRIEDTARSGVPWAADNDAFNSFDPEAFERMLAACSGLPGCLFVAAPDVVGDWPRTLRQYGEWAPAIREAGLPVAVILQDGLGEPAEVPRDADAVFVGGTDGFKLGPEAHAAVADAKRRGKWAHMGRVNSRRRVGYAATIGCDSFDGTQFSRWRDRWLDVGLGWAGDDVQLALEAP